MPEKSGNPALSDKTFAGLAASDNPMTLAGTINKTAILLALVLIGAGWVWNLYFAAHQPEAVMPYLLIGSIGGLVMALITTFKQTAAPYTAPIYALLEGLALGGLSAVFDMRYPGIAIQAVGLTFGTLFALLMVYSTGVIFKQTGAGSSIFLPVSVSSPVCWSIFNTTTLLPF